MTTLIDALNNGMAFAQTPVRDAIRAAASATGIGFDYLVTTAERESSLNPLARAHSSSASGLFQFIDSSWLSTMKEHGAELGFAQEAGAIRSTANGFVIDDQAMRQHIMALRFDPKANALMGAAYTQQNLSQLQSALGRAPSAGELYIAHFLGAQGASKFILGATQSPGASAADLFPQAALANPSIFYDHGNKRSLGAVYALLVGQHQGISLQYHNAPIQAQQIASAAGAAASIQAQNSALTNAAFKPLYHNIFAPDRQGGVSPVVNALWTRRVLADNTGSPGNAPTMNVHKPFFPMSRPLESSASTDTL
jgi:hypothetical protein